MQRTLFEEDHDSFRTSVREFVDRTLAPRAEQMRAEGRIPREVWTEAGAQGLLGLCIPEEHGGAGVDDYRFNTVVQEEIAAFSAGVCSNLLLHADIVAPYLVNLGTPEQQARWLPGAAAGEAILAIGMTEPSGGSDLAALRTTAARDADTGEWVLNGGKTFITNGGACDLAVVAARTNPGRGARGISLFLVPAGTPGFTKGEQLDKVGQHDADTAELFFTDVRLPADALLGEEGYGFIAMMEHLPQERLGTAIAAVANTRAVLEETITYAREREAFGQAIGSMQYNKFKIAELVTDLEVTQAFVDQCITAHVRKELTAVDAAKAKWWATDMQGRVLDVCVQLHGGYGFMNEYRVARAWADARVHRIWAGSNEIMKELIGRDLGL